MIWATSDKECRHRFFCQFINYPAIFQLWRHFYHKQQQISLPSTKRLLLISLIIAFPFRHSLEIFIYSINIHKFLSALKQRQLLSLIYWIFSNKFRCRYHCCCHRRRICSSHQFHFYDKFSTNSHQFERWFVFSFCLSTRLSKRWTWLSINSSVIHTKLHHQLMKTICCRKNDWDLMLNWLNVNHLTFCSRFLFASGLSMKMKSADTIIWALQSKERQMSVMSMPWRLQARQWWIDWKIQFNEFPILRSNWWVKSTTIDYGISSLLSMNRINFFSKTEKFIKFI